MAQKDWAKRLFAGQSLSRIPFVPLVYSYAAKLEQISVHAMYTDSGKLSKALQNAWRLYNYDAIVCPFDTSLEAEACGVELAWPNDDQLPVIASNFPANNEALQISIEGLEKKGRLPVVIDAMRRIKIVSGQSVPLVAVATGPLSLMARLRGKNVIQELENSSEGNKQFLDLSGRIITAVSRAYCELEPVILALVDDCILQLPSKYLSVVSSMFRTIGNLAHFYNAYLILITKNVTGQSLNVLGSLGLDGAIIGGEPEPSEIKYLEDKGLVMGVGIPFSKAAGSANELNDFILRYLEPEKRNRLFLSTESEVPFEMPAERIHDLVEFVNNL